jgi:hypothetical protein
MEEVKAYPECPHCHVPIEYIEQISSDYDDMYYFVNWSGLCRQCQRTFLFREDFKLVERKFVE